jgi:trimethylamine--corrinoid protein Co-methyltransferase
MSAGGDQLAVALIERTCLGGPGHYLARPPVREEARHTYPLIAERWSPREWEDKGRPDIVMRAVAEKRRVLAGRFPRHVSRTLDERLRARFGDLIRLPRSAMGV